MRRRTASIFGRVLSMKLCPPKPGFTDISSTRSSWSSVWSSQCSGVAGLSTRPAFTPNDRISCSVRNEMIEAPACANSGISASTGRTIM